MNEIVPGIFHWTAFHEGIRQRVSSYYVADSAALIDPMLPEQGVDWFKQPEPERILLTNRHHYRQSAEFVEAFGCPVLCHRAGLHEFEGGAAVEGFEFGDRLAPATVAFEVGAICPEETALHIDVGDGLVALADGLIRSGSGSLGFVPDFLLGDDPEAVKRGLRESFRRLVELDFDGLLFAHGLPLPAGGKEALRDFLT
jgi:hypothetical protein